MFDTRKSTPNLYILQNHDLEHVADHSPFFKLVNKKSCLHFIVWLMISYPVTLPESMIMCTLCFRLLVSLRSQMIWQLPNLDSSFVTHLSGNIIALLDCCAKQNLILSWGSSSCKSCRIDRRLNYERSAVTDSWVLRSVHMCIGAVSFRSILLAGYRRKSQ